MNGIFKFFLLFSSTYALEYEMTQDNYLNASWYPCSTGIYILKWEYLENNLFQP
jgi:hypothetical protein